MKKYILALAGIATFAALINAISEYRIHKIIARD
jgi:hypothetical protein